MLMLSSPLYLVFWICMYMFDLYSRYCRSKDENALEIDFGAYEFNSPHLTLSSSIGNGLNFVSKFLSAKLSGRREKAQPLVDYLLSLELHGEVCADAYTCLLSSNLYGRF